MVSWEIDGSIGSWKYMTPQEEIEDEDRMAEEYEAEKYDYHPRPEEEN